MHIPLPCPGAADIAFSLILSQSSTFTMSTRFVNHRNWSTTFLVGAVALSVSASCSSSVAEQELSNEELIGGTIAKGELPGTLKVNGICTATRVGPKHILLAAHCVHGGSPSGDAKTQMFAAKKPLTIQQAAVSSRKRNAPWLLGPPVVLTIVKTTPHPSYVQLCEQVRCGRIEYYDAADVAVIEVKEVLPKAIPIVPVMSKPTPVNTEVTLAGAGCEIAVGGAVPRPEEFRVKYEVTKTLPVNASNHFGSQMGTSAAQAALVESLMLITPGPALDPDAAGLCPGDSGGPLYGPGQRTVVGVASAYTFQPAAPGIPVVPVTNWHARTDDAGKYRIATWLKSLGVTIQ
jgi:Trypsin